MYCPSPDAVDDFGEKGIAISIDGLTYYFNDRDKLKELLDASCDDCRG